MTLTLVAPCSEGPGWLLTLTALFMQKGRVVLVT